MFIELLDVKGREFGIPYKSIAVIIEGENGACTLYATGLSGATDLEMHYQEVAEELPRAYFVECWDPDGELRRLVNVNHIKLVMANKDNPEHTGIYFTPIDMMLYVKGCVSDILDKLYVAEH